MTKNACPYASFGLLVAVWLTLAGTTPQLSSSIEAQEGRGVVHVVQVRNEIDLGLPPYLRRVLGEAEREAARAVIIEIDTPGGRLDAALQMREAILDTPVRTIAFVNRDAFSAGALIAIASSEIYMVPGSAIGAATPVDAAGEAASEKVISAVRSTFRATAEARGRDPRVAEAMVDPDVEIEGLVGRGKLLTLTTDEARDRGYADGVAADLEELLAVAGQGSVVVHETAPRPAENLVRFLTNPVVASLLISLGLLLLLGDAFTEGFGATGAVGLGLLGTFFWGHYLAGLAGWEGVALFALGLVLVGAEVFVIPGFGIAGLSGIIALLAGLFISLIGDRLVTNEDLTRAGYTVGAAFALVLLGMGVLLRYLPQLGRFQGLVLESHVGAPDLAPGGWQGRRFPPAPASLVSARGVALSDLRPGGFAQIEGERVDVVTRGDYVLAGEEVEVVADEGYRRVVRRLGAGAAGGDDADSEPRGQRGVGG